MSKRLKTYAGPHLTAAAGIAAPRAEHGGHAAVDLHVVEAVFAQAAGKTAYGQEHDRKREKEYSHIASSCRHHNQDVKHRKSFLSGRKKNEASLQVADFTFTLGKNLKKKDIKVLPIL